MSIENGLSIQRISNGDSAMSSHSYQGQYSEERYCKHCGALLNKQHGYSEYQYVWQCEECGELNRAFFNSDSDNINVYCDAISQEISYVRTKGGRKYKATNGRKLVKTEEGYIYVFELESELSITEESPVKIEISGDSYDGEVIVCEDFHIMLIVNKDLGNTVNVAFISAEPWKLLLALNKRMTNLNHAQHSIAMKILEEGPMKATNEDIRKIEKGQEITIDRAVTDEITVVWGPPGTGKTHTMSRIAIEQMRKGKKVLIASHSNISVDGVIKKIVELLEDEGTNAPIRAGKILRYGYIKDDLLKMNRYASSYNFTVMHKPVLKEESDRLQKELEIIRHKSDPFTAERAQIERKLTKIRKKIREEELHYINSAAILGTTISKVSVDSFFEGKQYDTVLFDESSMAYTPQIIEAASFARKHFVCVGDFRQLAPIAQSPAKVVLSNDIYRFLNIIDGAGKLHYHPWLVMLDQQRRMHPSISKFPRLRIYGGLLKDHESVLTSKQSIAASLPMPGSAMNLINLSSTYCAAGKSGDNSRFNILSACLLFASAVNAETNGCDSVGIVAPYMAQTRLIRALLKDYREQDNENSLIACSTVHQFQGSERDMILLDLVESYPFNKTGWLLSKDNGSVIRLINVAMTRARGKLIVSANRIFWKNMFETDGKSSNMAYKLLSYMSETSNVLQHKDRSLDQYIHTLQVGKTLKLYTDNSYEEEFIKDLRNAKKQILISIPYGKMEPEQAANLLKHLRQLRAKGIKVFIKAIERSSLPKDWIPVSEESENAIFPILMIDKKTIWYGLPKGITEFRDKKRATTYKTVCPIIMRIHGDYSVGLINSLANLEMVKTDGMTSQMYSGAGTDLLLQNKKTSISTYIQEHETCSKCGSPYTLAVNKSGKDYMRCTGCGGVAYINPSTVNAYIHIHNVKCKVHHCSLKAGLGKYGIYVRCEAGHFMKVHEME